MHKYKYIYMYIYACIYIYIYTHIYPPPGDGSVWWTLRSVLTISTRLHHRSLTCNKYKRQQPINNQSMHKLNQQTHTSEPWILDRSELVRKMSGSILLL